MTYSFNLVDQRWIPVVASDGRAVDVSLRELFLQAQDIKGIDADNPLISAALFRLVLAVVHRAIDGPKHIREWGALWEAKSFAGTKIDGYLTKWRERFDLFSDEYPFFQTAGFAPAEHTPAAKLTVDIASGNNKTLFSHARDASPIGFMPSEAARAVVTAQAFALGGGKGVTSNLFGEHPYLSHGPLVQGAVVFLEGANLFETVLLNLLIYADDRPIPRIGNDIPAWERDSPLEPGSRTPEGYVDYLTWMTRHIRLLPEGSPDQPIVRFMFIGQANAVTPVRDPGFAYKKLDKNELRPVGIQPDRSLWRDSSALFEIASDQDSGRPFAFRLVADAVGREYLNGNETQHCVVTGLANDKANPLLWRQERLPVSTRLLRDSATVESLNRGVRFAEDAGKALCQAARDLAQRILPPGADGKALSRFVSTIGTMERYWSTLDTHFNTFALGLSGNSTLALAGWKKQIRDAATKSFESTADNCLGRTARELEARVLAGFRLQGRLKKLD